MPPQTPACHAFGPGFRRDVLDRTSAAVGGGSRSTRRRHHRAPRPPIRASAQHAAAARGRACPGGHFHYEGWRRGRRAAAGGARALAAYRCRAAAAVSAAGAPACHAARCAGSAYGDLSQRPGRTHPLSRSAGGVVTDRGGDARERPQRGAGAARARPRRRAAARAAPLPRRTAVHADAAAAALSAALRPALVRWLGTRTGLAGAAAAASVAGRDACQLESPLGAATSFESGGS